MKQFYFDIADLQYSPHRDCNNCPHRKNSILASEGSQVNPLEKYIVYHAYLTKSQKYPNLEVARSALRLFCSVEYIFGRKHRDLTLKEKIYLSLKNDFKFVGNQCFCNGELFAEIRELF